MKKIFFANKEEHWKWCWENYIRFYGLFDEQSPWLPEDEVKMKPFFEWSSKRHENNVIMPPEVKEAFEHYDKCREAGLERRFNIDFVNEIEQEVLLQELGFEPYASENEDIDEDTDEFVNYSLENPPNVLEDIKYPCVMTYELSLEMDRIGKSIFCFVCFVTLEDFK